MAAAKPKWTPFPHESDAFDCAGDALAKRWARLHRGDAEPFPDATHPALALGKPGRDGAGRAPGVQDAWRAFHRGDFARAWTAGAALGPAGISAAVKAAGIYATYLERNDAQRTKILLDAVELAEEAAKAAPDYPNAHYFLAFALGRYSQRIPVMQALAAGHGTRIRQHLDRAIELEPGHADAHIALGVWNAEIVGKVGGLAARMTYGASADEAVRHFEEALRLFPESPIAHVEYADALLVLDAKKHRAKADALRAKAAKLRPADAMERLDVERARA